MNVSMPPPSFGQPRLPNDNVRPADDGWLGQVPPPTRPVEAEPVPQQSTYAVPQLAPEPWKSDPVLPGTDPTLFG